MVDCVHHIPGRARFRIEELRRDSALVALIEREVGSLDGVKAVEINQYAGSIVVHYCTERAALNAIMDHICAHCPKRRHALAAPRVPARTAPDTKARPAALHAVRDAAGKAVVNTFITRALERSLAGIVRF